MTEADAVAYSEMYVNPEAAVPLLLQSQHGTPEQRRRAWEALQWLDQDAEIPPPESEAERAARAIGVYVYLAMIHDPRRLERVLELVAA